MAVGERADEPGTFRHDSRDQFEFTRVGVFASDVGEVGGSGRGETGEIGEIARKLQQLVRVYIQMRRAALVYTDQRI